MQPTKRHATIITSDGLVVALIGWVARGTRSPGRLVAEEREILWRSPDSELGQPLTPAKARYRLTNQGGSPVHIVAVESGCGCTKPVPSATAIPPGQAITLDVEARPFPIGDRTVPITVRTDSPVTPTIDLRPRMIGSRRPPFPLDAVGELAFLNVERGKLIPMGERRQFKVRMVETANDSREPSFRVDPPAIMVTLASKKTEPHIGDGNVVRTCTYDVAFAEPPIEGRLAGTVVVVDPWFLEHQNELRVMAEVRSRLRAVPARIDLPADGSADFMVLMNATEAVALDQLQAEVRSPLVVEPISSRGSVATFRVRSTGPVASMATARIEVRHPAIPGESATILVSMPGVKP